MPTVLTASLVEGLHAAALKGQAANVTSAVAQVTNATLPGLVEYSCLANSNPSLGLPELPDLVRASAAGLALQRVACRFGLRKNGPTSENTSVNPSRAEFFVLRTEDDYQSPRYKLYETRWARASEKVGLRDCQSLMHKAMSAMTENGILHAEAEEVLVGYEMADRAILFTVADLGRGVLASLRTNPKYSHLEHSRDALRLALQDGVSRFNAGGNGFRDLFRALANRCGTLRFRTGNAAILMDGQRYDTDLGRAYFPDAIPGFHVSMVCRREESELQLI